MKRLSIIMCLFYFLVGSIIGQIRLSGLPAAEERAAKNLAVSFFNRFQQTPNFAPLIKIYFVRDLTRRLKYCYTTGECGGRDRDFWQKNEELITVNATETDTLRLYATSINYFFLYFRSVQYLNKNYPQKISEDNLQAAEKSINTQLESLLKDNPKLVKFNFFNDSDGEELTKVKSLNDLHCLLDDYEKLIAALRTLESTQRTKFQKENPAVKLSFAPTDFRVYAEENHSNFFDYPIGTKMIEVWSENDSLLFKMDLIKEHGKLKIVAIYPPMD